MPVFHCFGVEEWIEPRNIYTLLERLKMILHKLVTKGLSCEFSARDYSDRLAFMTGTPQKQPTPTDGGLSLVKTARNSLFVISCRRPLDPWSHLCEYVLRYQEPIIELARDATNPHCHESCFVQPSHYYVSGLMSHFQLPDSTPPNDRANNCGSHFVQKTVHIIINE